MGRKESTVELLVKVWEGIREFLEVPKESKGAFFRHMRVCYGLGPTHGGGSYIYLYNKLLCPASTHQPIFVALAMGVQEGKD